MSGQAMSAAAEGRFRELYADHYRPVLAYCLRRLPSHSDAEDSVAEVFAVAWRRMDGVPAGSDALPWLYAVARRVVGNADRTRRRRDRLTARVATRRDAEQGSAAADSSALVIDVLMRLRPLDQEVLRLAAWEGLQPLEIAAVLGCSPNAAAIRLHRARERFREQFDPTPAARPDALTAETRRAR
jgi:RNA polymerase sigma-70 factor (ECF subfamily)